MKKQSKKFMLAALVLLALAVVVLTSCGNVSNSSGTQEQSAYAKRIVQESVVAMEKMMGPAPAPQSSKLFSATYAPNHEFRLPEVKKLVLEASAINMYLSEYLVEAGMFDFGSTYKDSYTMFMWSESEEEKIEVKMEVAIRMEMVEDGVMSRIVNRGVALDDPQETRLYFFYDYELMEPSHIICIAPRDDNQRAFIELNYKTNEAVWWEFTADAKKSTTIQTALEQNNFSFATLVENGMEDYAVAKMNVQTGAGKAYEYRTNDDPLYSGEPSVSTGEFGTQEEAAALFDELYATAKDFLVEEKLNFDTAEQKVFAQEMMERGEKELEELIKKIN